MNPLNTGLLADLFEMIQTCGYRPGASFWVSPDARAIDALAAAEMICAECYRQGLGYHPFHLPRPRRYVAYAVGPECGWYEQF
jgi:hypothetical protein